MTKLEAKQLYRWVWDKYVRADGDWDQRRELGEDISIKESRDFWRWAEEVAAEVATRPDWMHAGFNVEAVTVSPGC